jgi:Fe-S cluster assembly protein SufD
MKAAAGALLEGFARLEAKRNGAQPFWLKGLRQVAFQWVSEHGFPSARDEAWKYTRVGPILEVPFAPAEPGIARRLSQQGIPQLAADVGGTQLVFVNGYFAPALSSLAQLPTGVKVTSLASALIEEGERLEPILSRPFRDQPHAFTALNAALAEDGAFVEIPSNAVLDEPIRLLYLTDTNASALASHPRSIILAGAGSRASIIESYAGILGDVYLTNAVTEVVLDEGATVEHYKLQNETETAFHVALLDVRQKAGSRFSSLSLALGSSIARHETKVRLEGEGASVFLNGLYMPRGEQHLDNPTTIEHAAPGCTSRELYKGVIDDHGRGVFDGRIVVQPGAAKTDASQTNKNLLLSEWAQVDTRPRLEIFADDVKCAHGAAVGQLDEDAIFYLRSRGIPPLAARNLLTYAFAREVVELVSLRPLRSWVEKMVAARLPGGAAEVAA